ncbi:lytic transglycosylase domain-containing protein [Quadrisphaera sp. DSM 44207]|uniref:aggregation-promoting factor C-terminal-like domain-containing protein n=1 Tax=Quadrisphaera sp. DSM 44207 TaxID=1881057 RepID=UPI0015A050CC|nr:lytic transglycosylase domain-containing protein [Quadrisphaera sp. DSM 44207]
MTSRPSWRALPRAVRRPVVLVATGAVALTVTGAGVTAGTSPPQPSPFTVQAPPRQPSEELAPRERAQPEDPGARSERLTAAAVSRSQERTAPAPQLPVDDPDRLAEERRLAEEQRRAAEAEAARQAEEAARQAEVAAREAEHRARVAAAVADPRSVARALAAERGWGRQQFSCLDALWTKESGWEHTADNPTSSAYGIPQSLPGRKMASAGADWETNPITQITWGLGYIADAYGTPCGAWAHSERVDWY